MRVLMGSLLTALVLAAPIAAGRDDHLRPSPSISLSGQQTSPGGVDFSPIPDPHRGAWRGTMTWNVGCANAEWWGWEIIFVDLSSGAYNNPTVDKRASQHAHDGAFAYTTTGSGGTRLTQIPAGSAVFPYMKAWCFGGGHRSETVELYGTPIHVPPYVWYPNFAGGSRSLQARPVVLRRNRRVTVRLRIDEYATGEESVRVFLEGAGVRVRKTYVQGQLDAVRAVSIRPTRAGVIRYWAVLAPYGARSRVVGIRVR